MARRELQGTDDRNGHDEENDISHHVDSRHDIPHRLKVQAVAWDCRIPEGLDGSADKGQHDAERDPPGPKS